MKSFFFFLFLIAAAGILSPAIGHCSPTEKPDGMVDLLFYSKKMPTEFILVEKNSQKIRLFEQSDELKLIKEFECATGKNPGPKKITGDSRTPEGVYFVTGLFEDKKVTVFGSRAFHLDYPNIFDTHAGHVGDGIYIHGTNKKLIPFSTNGCIALDNKDLDELAPHLTVNTIPIVVVEELREPLGGKNFLLQENTPRFNEILGALSFDLEKIPMKDIQSLSFLRLGERAVATIKYASYERDYMQYREQVRTYLTQSPVENWRTIYAVKRQEKDPYLLAMHPTKNDLVTKLPGALPTPVGEAEPPVLAEPALAQAKPPDQLAAAQPKEPAKAVPTTAQPTPAHPAKAAEPAQVDRLAHLAKQPAVAKVAQLTKGEEVLNFVEKWRSSWVTKDIEAYISCYSPSFKNEGLNREGWKRKKQSLNKKYSYINVSIKNIMVQWTPTGANVSFFQTYRSDQYQTTGTKVLQMSNKNNRWMIESEIM